MIRSIVPAATVAFLCVIAGTLAGCARYGSEHLLLEQFFALSRLRDRTALHRISTVVFEPLIDGAVTDFSISAVTGPEPGESARPENSKRVNVEATVRLPDGETARRRIVLVLELRDRWIVTGFTVVRP